MRGKAQRVDRPAQTRLQNKGYWTPKFTKRLPNVEDLSAVLTKKNGRLACLTSNP